MESKKASKGFDKRILAGIVLVLIVVAGVFAYYQFGSAFQTPTETVKIDIKTVNVNGVEHHVFDPVTVTVHKGNHVVLIVTNTDESPHGLMISQMRLDTGPLRANEQAKLEFDANITGTYDFVCSVPGCAPDHAEMVGQLIVTSSGY